MSELRQDRITGRWTIIAPQRGRRPFEARPLPGGASTETPSHSCPFCPGHEAELPGIIAETAASEAPGWQVRAIPNKFPAVQIDSIAPTVAGRDHRSYPARGLHEVVIESPRHDADLATMARSELFAVASMYRERCRVLLAQPGIETVVLFRNRGASAGASQDHPHSQIVALGLVPPRMEELASTALSHFERHGCCATCTELDVERRDGRRLVDEGEQFLALVPFAAQHPYEVWVVPRRHVASFSETDDAELGDFSNLLGRTLRRIQTATNGAAYRFVVESAPRSGISAPHLHWRLRIVPSLVTPGGFELGAGMAINPSCPEDDAAVLREIGQDSAAR